MNVRLLVASRSDVGRVRPGNEDAVLVADDARLVAVADGMGGHQAGEVASETAISALLDGVHRGDPIGDAVTSANDAVFSKAAADLSLRGMGTTLTAGVLDGTRLVIGHVGDSRAYLVRAGALSQLTTDHSVIAELVAAGELTEDEALVDPRRAMITRALGIDASVAVDVLTVDLVPGDRLMLCSDGLTTMVRDDVIAQILVSEPDRDRAADVLVATANAAGGADNITVVVADVVADDVPAAVPADVTAEATADAQPTVASDDGDTAVGSDGPGAALAALPRAPAPAAPPDPFGAVEPVADPPPAEPEPTAESDPGLDHAVDPELDELRAAVDEVAPRRRRWWRRRK